MSAYEVADPDRGPPHRLDPRQERACRGRSRGLPGPAGAFGNRHRRIGSLRALNLDPAHPTGCSAADRALSDRRRFCVRRRFPSRTAQRLTLLCRLDPSTHCARAQRWYPGRGSSRSRRTLNSKSRGARLRRLFVSVRRSHLDAEQCAVIGGSDQFVAVPSRQRCGSNSPTRLAGCVGSFSSTSLR